MFVAINREERVKDIRGDVGAFGLWMDESRVIALDFAAQDDGTAEHIGWVMINALGQLGPGCGRRGVRPLHIHETA